MRSQGLQLAPGRIRGQSAQGLNGACTRPACIAHTNYFWVCMGGLKA